MRAKQIIGSLVFIVVLNVCVKAQFLNFNTRSNRSPANNFATAQQQQQSNGRVPRQQSQQQQQQQPRRTQQAQDGQIDTIIIIEKESQRPHVQQPQRQPQRQQTQTNRPVQHQQTKVPQRQQSQQTHTQRVTQNNPDTIIIIQSEPQRPQVKPTQRQPQRQPQIQQTTQRQPQRQQAQVQQTTSKAPRRQQSQQTHSQQQTQRQPQRQQPTQQSFVATQRQPSTRPTRQPSTRPTQSQQFQTTRTTRQPQFQQQQQQTQQPQLQQQYHQQTHSERPIHGDAPVIFPGSTSNPHRPTEPSLTFSRPSNQFSVPTTAISPLSQGFVENSGNFASNGVNSFNGAIIDEVGRPSSNGFNTFNSAQSSVVPSQNAGFNNGLLTGTSNTGFISGANPTGFVPDNSFGTSVGVGSTSNGFGNGFNGNGVNNFDNGQFLSGSNGIPTNNFDNSFVGPGVGSNVGAPFEDSRWYNPHRPRGNYYRNFAAIFNDIDQKAENDYNTSEEDDEVNDDFNGRSVVTPGQYPHMAALGYRTSSGDTEFKCGGSLISEMFVLTAAHCCFLNGQAPHLVKIGDIKLKEFEHDIVPQRRGIAKVHKHPYYNTSMHYHDIGLLELTNPIAYTFFVRPIRLWASDEIPYSKVFTMGYGSTSFAQAPTNVLTELDLTIVPLETCNQSMPSDPNAPEGIMETQICAKDFEKNRDTCQGDSGGPLQLNLERPRRRRLRYYLVGVISYGTFCRSRYPGVYTRVSSYIDWIASIVWPNYLNRFQD